MVAMLAICIDIGVLAHIVHTIMLMVLTMNVHIIIFIATNFNCVSHLMHINHVAHALNLTVQLG